MEMIIIINEVISTFKMYYVMMGNSSYTNVTFSLYTLSGHKKEYDAEDKVVNIA